MPRATPPNNNNDRQAVRGLTKASMNHCMQLQHLQAVPACPVALQAVSACIFRMSECCFASGRPRPVTLVKPRQLSLQRRRCGSAVASLTPFPPPPWQPPALQSKLGRGRCLAAGCRRGQAAEQDSSPPSDVRNLGATTANKCQGVIKSIIVMNPRRHWWRRRHG